MNINKLRQRITFQEDAGAVNDGGGNLIKTWLPVANTWAAVIPVTGSEQVIANQDGEQITHKVTTRYRDDIQKDRHRILFKGRILHIDYIINVEERNTELNIFCKEAER